MTRFLGRTVQLSTNWKKQAIFALRGILHGAYDSLADALKAYQAIPDPPDRARVYAATESKEDHDEERVLYYLLLPPLSGEGIPRHCYSACQVDVFRKTRKTISKPKKERHRHSCRQAYRLPPQSKTTRLNRRYEY